MGIVGFKDGNISLDGVKIEDWFVAVNCMTGEVICAAQSNKAIDTIIKQDFFDFEDIAYVTIQLLSKEMSKDEKYLAYLKLTWLMENEVINDSTAVVFGNMNNKETLRLLRPVDVAVKLRGRHAN